MAHAPFAERLWRHIDKRGPRECWPWTATTGNSGYGLINRGGNKVRAHRAVWADVFGPIPNGPGYHGIVVMHICDNRACCNPGHLMLGTQARNTLDMDAKGRRRMPRGTEHGRSRFTEADIHEIRNSKETQAVLAKRFGCSTSGINHIITRRCWKHLP